MPGNFSKDFSPYQNLQLLTSPLCILMKVFSNTSNCGLPTTSTIVSYCVYFTFNRQNPLNIAHHDLRSWACYSAATPAKTNKRQQPQQQPPCSSHWLTAPITKMRKLRCQKRLITYLPGFKVDCLVAPPSPSDPPPPSALSFSWAELGSKTWRHLSSVQDLDVSIIHIPDEATWSH